MKAVYALVLAFGLSACGGAATTQPATPPGGSSSPVAWYPKQPSAAPASAAAAVAPEHAALAKEALSQGPTGEAAEQLRQLGAVGLNALLAADDGSEAARAVIEAVARQRDARHSGLYWYTDLEAAKAEASATQRPILSLRLLGRLDQELSCANSRFFRTALYANRTVSAYLRKHFVLHWKSERPAPRVTVDFGDGRRLERTFTGNSIHYVLDARGRIVDALPGLYGPKAFVGLLSNAEAVAGELHAVGVEPMRAGILSSHHGRRASAIAAAWSADLASLGLSLPMVEPDQVEQPEAADAMANAFPKMVVEGPTLAAITPPTGKQLEGLTDEALWRRIAERRGALAKLDASSIALMRDKSPARLLPGGRLQALDAAGLNSLAASFEKSMALDTVRNEYLLHRKIHQWLQNTAIADMEALNSRVYAELFLTPASDPWMGLVSNNVYTAIDHDGLSVTPTQEHLR